MMKYTINKIFENLLSFHRDQNILSRFMDNQTAELGINSGSWKFLIFGL